MALEAGEGNQEQQTDGREQETDSEDELLVVYSGGENGEESGQQKALLPNDHQQPAHPAPQQYTSPRLRAGSFSFSFSTHLLPLSNSLEVVQHSLPTLSATSAIALVVSAQIGSGIFSSPGTLSLSFLLLLSFPAQPLKLTSLYYSLIGQNCGSPGESLIVWLLAGILAWTGASSFAELGAAIPVNGGAQAYLNYSFGGWASYLFIWTNLVALKVCPLDLSLSLSLFPHMISYCTYMLYLFNYISPQIFI
jgi:hypothetical protein